jgi:hypothetical protein
MSIEGGARPDVVWRTWLGRASVCARPNIRVVRKKSGLARTPALPFRALRVFPSSLLTPLWIPPSVWQPVSEVGRGFDSPRVATPIHPARHRSQILMRQNRAIEAVRILARFRIQEDAG